MTGEGGGVQIAGIADIGKAKPTTEAQRHGDQWKSADRKGRSLNHKGHPFDFAQGRLRKRKERDELEIGQKGNRLP